MAALLDLRMPGVYTQEIATLPPTVGVIPSAVPVFIGYTERCEKNGEPLLNKPTRVKSMKEFEDWFGGPKSAAITLNVQDPPSDALNPNVQVTEVKNYFYMYYSMLLYYANGGGPCYIISVGNYPTEADGKPKKENLTSALKLAVKIKDITIITFPDGISLSETDYASVVVESMLHCVKMKNRVTVIDVHAANGEDISKFEAGFQTNMPSDIEVKKYGISYYPYIDTIFSYAYDKSSITIPEYNNGGNPAIKAGQLLLINDFKTSAAAYLLAQKKAVGLTEIKNSKQELEELKTKIEQYRTDNPGKTNDEYKTQLFDYAINAAFTIPPYLLSEMNAANADSIAILNDFISNIDAKLNTAVADEASKKTAAHAGSKNLSAGYKASDGKVYLSFGGLNLSELEIANNTFFGKIKDTIQKFPVTLPPCGAIAGIYVRTDATQGVWKAPANVSVFGAIKPALDIDDDLHASLNAPSSGKAINVIRAYPGRGILVYGGRTLAGNDLEWRYVNVRRTFCFIEDSIARAMQDFVFEPNNQQTWIKVRAMIKSFLNRLWKAGGLYGNTPEDAYEVIVGEPESMSVEDVLSGIMRIYIKVAVARPAEFIVLQYEHKFELSEA